MSRAINLVDRNEYKRRQSPPGIRIQARRLDVIGAIRLRRATEGFSGLLVTVCKKASHFYTLLPRQSAINQSDISGLKVRLKTRHHDKYSAHHPDHSTYPKTFQIIPDHHLNSCNTSWQKLNFVHIKINLANESIKACLALK